MDMQDNQRIYGIPDGVLYGQMDKANEINERMSSRYFADSPLEPQYDPRQVQTKRTLFPLVKNSQHTVEPELPYPVYRPQSNFNPGNRRAPSSGFIHNIDVETVLRNQTFALQHGASQSVYVPSSSSELYNVTIASSPSVQPYPNLFATPMFSNQMHPNLAGVNIGNERFFNHTRTQLRNQ